MGKESILEKKIKFEALAIMATALRKSGSISAASRIERKIAKNGAIKLGINKIGTPKKEKTEKPIVVKFDFKEYNANQKLEKEIEEEILLEKSMAISIYCEKHSCSRKIARKAMSSERRLAKKSA